MGVVAKKERRNTNRTRPKDQYSPRPFSLSYSFFRRTSLAIYFPSCPLLPPYGPVRTFPSPSAFPCMTELTINLQDNNTHSLGKTCNVHQSTSASFEMCACHYAHCVTHTHTMIVLYLSIHFYGYTTIHIILQTPSKVLYRITKRLNQWISNEKILIHFINRHNPLM